MNIYNSLFKAFSKFSISDFIPYVEQQMIPDFIKYAVSNNLPLREIFGREMDEIQLFLSEKSQAEVWRNPESFAQISMLNYLPFENELEIALLNLKLHLGMLEIDKFKDLQKHFCRFYRLLHSHNCLIEVDERTKTTKVVQNLYHVLPSGNVIYLPANELFADLFESDKYPDSALHYSSQDLLQSVHSSFELIEKYSPEILEDFHNTVRNIVLIPDAGSSKNTSYTCRLSYFGGIFVNPFGIDEYRLVESLIHEYYHQRLWQWWSYEDIDGLPPFEVCITSPMTGLSRPAAVMLQAFAIYISALHFYCHAHNNFPPTTASILESLNKRVKHIRQGIPPLYERLKSSINSTTITSSMIDFLFEEFGKIPT